jgi:hypothetical protein
VARGEVFVRRSGEIENAALGRLMREPGTWIHIRTLATELDCGVAHLRRIIGDAIKIDPWIGDMDTFQCPGGEHWDHVHKIADYDGWSFEPGWSNVEHARRLRSRQNTKQSVVEGQAEVRQYGGLDPEWTFIDIHGLWGPINDRTLVLNRDGRLFELRPVGHLSADLSGMLGW